MKKHKNVIIITIILMFTANQVFAQISIKDIQDAINGFSKEVSLAAPFNSTIGLNWADAYIGKLFPSVPPHFGVGFSVGFTTLGTGAIDKALSAAGSSGSSIPSFLRNMGLPLPAYTVEGRIGGFILPFDIGLKFGILPLKLSDYEIDYLLAGIDFRYAVLDKPVLPIKVSVGLGYNYLRGGIGVRIGSVSYNVPDGGGGNYTIKLHDPKIGFLWNTHCIELKGQLSLKIPVITPYVGAGLSVAFSGAGYKFNAKLTDELNNDISAAIVEALQALGISGISNNGFESISKTTSFNIRLYGGISFNLAFIKIDLTGLYNLTSNNFGVTIGGRFQL